MTDQNTLADLSSTPALNLNIKGQSQQGTAPANTIDNIFQRYGASLHDFYNSIGGVATVSGTNTYTVTITEDWAALASGLILAVKIPNANTGAATLNVTVPTAGALGAKAIRRQGDTALSANDMLANGIYLLRYSSTYNSSAGAWVLLNGAGGGVASVNGNTGAVTVIEGKLVAVLSPLNNRPPASNYATLDTRNSIPVLEFDTTTQEAAVWGFQVPSTYPGNGFVVTFWAAADTATSGTIGFDGAFETDNGLDLDGDSFDTAQTFTAATVSGTAGIATKYTLTFSNSQVDSLAANDAARFRLRRDVANDSASGDAQFAGGVIEFA